MALTRLGPNQAVNLASNVTGALPVANGGTALTSGFVNGVANPGKILQHATATTTGEHTNSSATWSTFSGINVSLTTIGANSKFLFVINPVRYFFYNGSSDAGELNIRVGNGNTSSNLQRLYKPSGVTHGYWLPTSFLLYGTESAGTALTCILQSSCPTGSSSIGIGDNGQTSRMTVFEIGA